MLRQIIISNFAIIKNLDLDLTSGMTVVTGETGAGKSIVIDALDIALGCRADPQLIRHDAERCEINLVFDITNIPQAQKWLNQQELSSASECIIRRQLLRGGRSKSFINGTPVTLQQLRQLALYLVHIHSQHQHHALMQKDNQREILDRLIDQRTLLADVKQAYLQWQQAKQTLEEFLSLKIDDANRALLEYQVEELNEIAPQEDEWQQLTKQQQQLAHSETLQADLQYCLAVLNDDSQPGLCHQLNSIEQRLVEVQKHFPECTNTLDLIRSANIQLSEAYDEILNLHQAIEANPEALTQIDQRVTLLHSAARKHHVSPENLVFHHQHLQAKLDKYAGCEQQEIDLEQQVSKQWQIYKQLATQLHQARATTAAKISKQITKSIQSLSLPKAQFSIQVDFKETAASQSGMDQVEFLININPGAAMMSMAKVASGGELSRISLAIQVITAQQDDTPTLVFDEVDVGISGATAEIVGKLLRQLGHKSQVLCITHLPQVAAQGQQHIKIFKKNTAKQTISELTTLNREQRIEEIARMVGGIKITQQTLAHAEELLAEA